MVDFNLNLNQKMPMKKQEFPKIIKKTSTNNMQESGCCFTSCGGMPKSCPAIQNNKKYLKQIFKKIKK
jgi:hypothetical protein